MIPPEITYKRSEVILEDHIYICLGLKYGSLLLEHSSIFKRNIITLAIFKANVNCAVILESHLVRIFNRILWRLPVSQ